jgi:hypothetical protein
LNNAEAEKEAQRKLQNFDLDYESVRCADASTLHALIPYVKRLVRLYPHIKERVKDKLSSSHIRNTVCEYETLLSVTNIDQITLYFNPGALGLREFLDSD